MQPHICDSGYVILKVRRVCNCKQKEAFSNSCHLLYTSMYKKPLILALTMLIFAIGLAVSPDCGHVPEPHIMRWDGSPPDIWKTSFTM